MRCKFYTVQIYNNCWNFLLVSLSSFIPNYFFQFSFRWQQITLESQQWACDDAFESCKPHSAKNICQYIGLIVCIDRNTVMLDSVRTSRNLWFRHRMLTHSLWLFNLIIIFFSCFPVALIEVIIYQYNLHKNMMTLVMLAILQKNRIKYWMKIWRGNDNAFSVAILDKVNNFNNERKNMWTQKMLLVL